MESSDAKHGSQSVRVAVNIRPLVTTELLVGCSDCTSVTPGEPQVNRDPVTAQVQRMKNQIEQLQAEPFEELQILKQKIALLETSNADLQNQLQEHQVNVQHLTKQALDAQDVDLLKTYVAKVQELEGELLRLRRLNTSKRNELIDFMDLDDNVLHPKSSLFPESDLKATEVAGDSEVEVKKLEHCSLQEKLDNELKELDKKLEQKEAEMKRYEKKVQELEIEKRKMQKEIEQLMCKLANISSTSDDSTQKMKESYLQKLNFLESQVAELKKKQDAHSQLLRQKQKSDDAAKKKLQDEIHRIKTQKVQLQQKIKQESEQFRLWKASREKEVLQLRKEGRRNEYEMHKLLALNQRQKMVLQRKTEEASMATKRLKELLESRKASSRDTYGNGSGPGFQALMQAIEHELEVTVRVHEVRCEHERQKEERVKMAKEVAELKAEAHIAKQSDLSHCSQTMSPGARNSRIFALENMLATSSKTIVSMASQLSEAEERERAFSGRGRWNQVRNLAEAKNVMNHLFNLASSSRCQLWDKEVDCREKDSEIRSLKEKIVNLLRQIEMQKAELTRMEKIKKLYMSKSFKKKSVQDSTIMDDGEGHMYDLRFKGFRNSIAYKSSGNIDELLEDMEISESEHSDLDETDTEWLQSEDFQDEWGNRRKQNAKKRNSKIIPDTNFASGAQKTPPIEDNDSNTLQKAPSGVCCSCSKYSSCKTMKCECRAVDGSCSLSCGCHPKKCSNRAAVMVQPDLVPSVTEGPIVNILSDDEESDKNSSELASHGAMLLQAALSDKPVETADDAKRKPLSDIGNKVAKPNASKPPTARKKWRKSTPIQVVTVPQQTPAQTEEPEPPKKQESIAVEPTKLRLPRAMRSANSNLNPNPLRDRNSELSNDSTINKEPEPKSPRHLTRPTTMEKENQG